MVKNITLSLQHCQHSTKMLTFIIAKQARSQSHLRQPQDTNKTLLLIFHFSIIHFMKHLEKRKTTRKCQVSLYLTSKKYNFRKLNPILEYSIFHSLNGKLNSYELHTPLTFNLFNLMLLVWLKSIFKTHINQSNYNCAYLVPTETIPMSFLNVGLIGWGKIVAGGLSPAIINSNKRKKKLATTW